MTDSCLLIGDLGGTNARFALADPVLAAFSHVRTLACSGFENAEAAMRSYLEETGNPRLDAICLAAAGPVVNGTVRFLNNHWNLDEAQLHNGFGGAACRLINDFEAIARSIPLLSQDDLEPVGHIKPRIEDNQDFSVAVIGPGTGLGIAGLIHKEGLLVPVTGEGGHVGFAPETHAQVEVLKYLREQYERVSNERLVSGPGLESVYCAMQEIHGEKATRRNAAQIFERAQGNRDESASETIQLFFEALGQVAGNLALTLGAKDGVFIAGGIVQRYPDLLKSSGFRSGFENKGRHRSLMERIPTALITHQNPGLLGASAVARSLLNL